MTLYLSQKKLLVLLLWAFALGFLLALVYDLLRLFRVKKRLSRKWLAFLHALWVSVSDFVFFLFGGIAMAILFFVKNYGKVRPSAFLMAVLGFLFCRVTLSKVTYPLLVRAQAWLGRWLGFLAKCLLFAPIGWICRLLGRVFLWWRKVCRRRKSKKLFRLLCHLGDDGYDTGLSRL